LGISKERKDHADTQNMISEVSEKYGNAVSVEYSDKIIALTHSENNPSFTQLTPYPSQSVMLPAIITILVLTGVVFVIATRRKMLILQTNHGTAVSTVRPPSAKDVEDMVKQAYSFVLHAISFLAVIITGAVK
jgi:hypothetical protein